MKLSLPTAVILLLSSCVGDPASPPPPPPPVATKGVYILNEGRFQLGNASLSYYDVQSGQVSNDVFFAVNNRHLGDVGNSIVLRQDRVYIIVNNSHKIEVIDAADFHSIGTIDIGSPRSPRQMAFVNDTLALVTNLGDDSVLPLDVKNMTVGSRIPVGSNPEGIAISDGKAFVANSGLGSGRTLTVVSLATFSAVRTLDVGDNPQDVQVTEEGLVYVVCAGSFVPDTPAKVFVVDPRLETVIDSIFIGGHAFRIAPGKDGRAYIPVGDSVVIVNTRIHRLAGTFTRGVAYYGVAVDTVSGDVYLSDPLDYSQPGAVHVYTSSAERRISFDAGVIPGSFAFKR